MTQTTTAQSTSTGSLIGRDLYVPRMSIETASVMAATYRSVGVNGKVAPESDARSLDLARQHTIGEECFPEIVTLGSFLKVIDEPGFDPEKTAFMMPTADGPCRFGQYKSLLEKVLDEKGLGNVTVESPSSVNGYESIGDAAGGIIRRGWWAVVCGDGIRKITLATRPYEQNAGDTDKLHDASLEKLCDLLSLRDIPDKDRFKLLVEFMEEMAEAFGNIPATYVRDKPLIGVVGEIYCRLDDFANAELIRRIERFGGEAWLASVSEWVFYSNFLQIGDMKRELGRFSKDVVGAVIRDKVQIRDEHALMAPLHKRFEGYEEPKSTASMIKPAEPYMPHWGAIGEMVLNTGGCIYLHGKGADGIIDISPFTCMNGIVCEAVYPKISKDYDDMPIRNFYFDGTESDYDRDVEIFLELAQTYRNRKKVPRIFPQHFS
jgi:predicted nucleotide-binding protein (sugar kinase/HSP70/actin superfamily)